MKDGNEKQASVEPGATATSAKPEQRAPFWAGGLRFECQPGCGECCRAAGEVFFTRDDVRRAADFLNVTFEHFVASHLQSYAADLWTLTVPDASQCPFLADDHRCKIQPAKPVQCATFPFWPEHLASRTAYRRVGARCPGIEQGGLVSARRIAAQLKLHAKAKLP